MFKRSFPLDFAPLDWWHQSSFENGDKLSEQPQRDLRYDDVQGFSDEDKRVLGTPGCLDHHLGWIRGYGFALDERWRRCLHTVAYRLASTGQKSMLVNDFNRIMSGIYWPTASKFKSRYPMFSDVAEVRKKRESAARKFRDWSENFDRNNFISKDKVRPDRGPLLDKTGQGYLFFTSLQKARLITACKPPSAGTYDGHPIKPGEDKP